jgi:diguanylate cyclase (GGDEF)-like protein
MTMSHLAREPRFIRAREQPPRLVLRFAVCAALGVAAAAAVILVVVRHADTARAQGQAIDHAQFAARAVLAPELRAEDLSGPPAAKRRRTLDHFFARRVLVDGIRDATLYGADGRMLYSSAGEGFAHRAKSTHVLGALGGAVVSEVATAEDGSRVLRTYVPIAGGAGRAAGVIALDQEYGHIETAVRRSSWLIAGVLEALLLLLFLVFAPLLARVASRIRGHVEELDRIATHDELTGLPNRLALHRVGDALLETGGDGCLLLIDLDAFSEIDDCLGCESGDALLAEVAARLRSDLPSAHFVGRLGEDEFAVILRGATREQIELVSERLQQSLAAPVAIGGVSVSVSVSVGAALFPEHGSDFGTVLRRASAALSLAKQDGQSSVQVYDPTHASSDVSRVTFAAALRQALEEGQLLLHFQPQADLMTHRVRGVEALLRWEHPERGLLSAGEFISYAERSGLATELRHFILDAAARQWRKWKALDIELELAVNLSAVDLLDLSLPGEIESLLERHRIPTWNLILEITERTLIGDERRTREVMESIAARGVRFALDDFGTGYSSLASLRKFPISQVKLDKDLLAGVPGDAAAEAIVGGSIEIAHGVGATVVAEGIETRAQWRFAFLMGCDVAQGYLIGRPTTGDDLTELLEAPRLVPLTAA